MTNESPGLEPQWIAHGEVLPPDAQAILRADSEAKRLMVGAGLDMDYFAAEIIRARADVSIRTCHGCGDAFVRDESFRHRIDAHTTIRWSSAREVI